MMKKLSFHLILLSSLYFGQTGNVGINTVTPKKTLHVNGSLQVTNEFNVGGSDTTVGSAGSPGQVLVSQGAGTPPAWNTLRELSGQSSLAFNIFSTGKSVNGSTSFNSIPGLNYTYTAPADGVLLIQATIYTALGENSGSGSLVFTNTQIAIRVNGTEAFYGMSTPIGSASPPAAFNPETTLVVGKLSVIKGQTYTLDVVAKDFYKFGGTTGAYAGTYTWNAYSSQSSIIATLITN
ncbi:hypothetical protein [Chryseobacterium sp. 22458]|uniref:hypothetical protein n=1 Tax=Chryseobacterium sp. 22458 TaxID=3453921 RepID=UPI003F87590A